MNLCALSPPPISSPHFLNIFTGKNISMQKMGEILGYPCFADYDPKIKENHNFVININV